MSDAPTPSSAAPPRVLPVRYAAPQPPPPSGGSVWRVFFALVLFASIALNLFLCGGSLMLGSLTSDHDTDSITIRERFHSGVSGAADKVAVVQIEGTIMEGLLGYAHKQIERAASDRNVKAVVVRIVSPGGTITASEDLHRQLAHLRDGTTPKFLTSGTAPKPLVVSMGAMAASGGYYIAMPAALDPQKLSEKKLFAEPTTITGSIGVYASFPNIAKFADEHGIKMEMIKAGDVKGSGSMFHEMSPQERQPWEDMIEHAYKQFVTVVEAGRPALKGKLTEDLFAPKTITLHDDKGNVKTDKDGKPLTTTYTRKRADGGIFTADDARTYGLIDDIGTLDDAIKEVASQVGLTDGRYRAVTYERPVSLLGLLGASDRAQPPSSLEVGKLAGLLEPHVWYLTPQSEMSAILRVLGRQ